MAIERSDGGTTYFDLDEAREVLGHSVYLIDNLGEGGSLNRICSGLRLDGSGNPGIYLDLPTGRGGEA